MTTNVLILCTHNSARSVLAEGMLNFWAKRLNIDLQAYSAGSSPSGRVNPFALEALSTTGLSTAQFRSKSWDEFSTAQSPKMKLVVTVCDSAAGEACPLWPGSPIKTHWGYPDPSNTPGGDEAKQRAFELTRQAIAYRMRQLVQIPFHDLSDQQLMDALNAIARS
jgi:arsenate reductase (thioredoxin)